MRRVTCRIRISFSLYRSTPHAKDTTHHASIHVAFPSFMCEPSEVERLNFSYMLPSLMFISVMRFQYAKDERDIISLHLISIVRKPPGRLRMTPLHHQRYKALQIWAEME